jgi:hypothetical protein
LTRSDDRNVASGLDDSGGQDALARILDLCEHMQRDQAAIQATARDLFSALAATRMPGRPRAPRIPLSLPRLLAAYERSLVLWALARSRGEQTTAARLLGIRATTLNEKMKRMGISRPHEAALQAPPAFGSASVPHGDLLQRERSTNRASASRRGYER